MNSVTIFALIAVSLLAYFASSAAALPIVQEVYVVPVQDVVDSSVPITLLDVESADQSAVDASNESARVARGLGLLGGKFGGLGGLGGLGHGFKGFGGFGGLGFGGLGGGLGHGLGGIKPFFGKPFFG